MNVEFGHIADRVPCTRGGEARDCVKLVLTSVSDPEKTAEVITAFVNQMASQMGQEIPEEEVAGMTMSITHEVSIITEPDTLIPHHAVIEKWLDAKIPGGPGEQESHDRTEITYTYDAPEATSAAARWGGE